MRKKVNNILKGALAAGTVLGGSAVISDVDVVYAAEMEKPESSEIVISSSDEGSRSTDESRPSDDRSEAHSSRDDSHESS